MLCIQSKKMVYQGKYSIERDILADMLDPETSDGQLLRLAMRVYDLHFTYHEEFWSYYIEWHTYYNVSTDDVDLFWRFEFNNDSAYDAMMDLVVQTLWIRCFTSQPKSMV